MTQVVAASETWVMVRDHITGHDKQKLSWHYFNANFKRSS